MGAFRRFMNKWGGLADAGCEASAGASLGEEGQKER